MCMQDRLEMKDISVFPRCCFRILRSRACRHSARCPPNYTSYTILLSALGRGVSFRFDLCKLVCSFSFFFSQVDYLKQLVAWWTGITIQLLTLSNGLIYQHAWLVIIRRSFWLRGSAAPTSAVQSSAQHSCVEVVLVCRFMLRYR